MDKVGFFKRVTKVFLPEARLGRCMIKIFRGEGVVDGVGGSSERCLKWGGGGHEVTKPRNLASTVF